MARDSIRISTNGPIDGRNDSIPFSIEDPSKINKSLTMKLHRAMGIHQCRQLEAQYGQKVLAYTDEEIEQRAMADENEKESKDSYAYLNQPYAEQCERRGIDATKFLDRRAKLQEHGRDIPQLRGLDGGTDTSLVGIDYNHEWFRDLRLAGKLVPHFSRQIDIPVGYATWNSPVAGDAQFLKQSALTTNAFTVNNAVNPTSSSITLTPQKMMSVIFVSGELTEDSLVPIIENLKMSFIRGSNVAIEHVLINGDTVTTTANINCRGSSGTALGTLDPRLMMDGLRALDFKGTTRKSASTYSGVDCSNSIATLNAVTGGLMAMGKYADDPSKVLSILPVRVAKQILEDSKARPDTYSALIDASNGVLNSVSGSKVVTIGNSLVTDASSGGIPTYALWNSEGYPVNLNASGNYDAVTTTRTGFVQVREDNIAWGWKRQLVIKVVDLPLGDQVAIAASMRFAFTPIIAGEGFAASYNASLT